MNDPFAEDAMDMSDDEYDLDNRVAAANPLEDDELPTLIQDYDFNLNHQEDAPANGKISSQNEVSVADSVDIRSSTVNHLNTGLAIASKNKNKKRLDVRKGIMFEKNNNNRQEAPGGAHDAGARDSMVNASLCQLDTRSSSSTSSQGRHGPGDFSIVQQSSSGFDLKAG